MAKFNGTADQIESTDNKANEIKVSEAGEKQYPTVNAVGKYAVPIFENGAPTEVIYAQNTSEAAGVYGGKPITLYVDFNKDNRSVEQDPESDQYCIPMRNKKGNLYTGTPTETMEAANKKYVDDAVANIDIPEGSGESITVDQAYSPESENAQSGKAVAEAVEPKLDKMTDKASQVASGNAKPKIYAVDRVDGVFTDILLKGSFDAEPHVVPLLNNAGRIKFNTYDANSGINVQDTGSGNGDAMGANVGYVRLFVSKNIEAVKKFVSDTVGNLNIPSQTDITNRATSVFNSNFIPRKLNHKWIAANGTVQITRSTMYFCCCSGSGDVRVVDENGTAVTDGEGDSISTAKVFILLVPENTTSYNSVKGYMCFYVGIKEGSSILSSIDGGAGNIFVPTADMEAGNRFIKTAGGMNVWTMPFDL